MDRATLLIATVLTALFILPSLCYLLWGKTLPQDGVVMVR